MNNAALSVQCSTYGSALCPCILASLEECLICSHLQGRELCNCTWSNYCVYINYLHDRKRIPKAAGNLLVPLRVVSADFGFCLYFSAPESLLTRVRPLQTILFGYGPKGDKTISSVILDTYPEYGVISAAVSKREAEIGLLTEGSPPLYPFLTEINAIRNLELIREIRGPRIMVTAGGFGQLLVYPLVKHYIPQGSDITVLLSSSLPPAQKLQNLGARCIVTSPDTVFDSCISLGSPSFYIQASNILHLEIDPEHINP